MSDPLWIQAHQELVQLHEEKSGGYGTGQDALANFVAVAAVSGRPAFLYPLDRIVEKITRVYSLEAQGRRDEIPEELRDIASSGLCSDALLRRERENPRLYDEALEALEARLGDEE